MRTVVLVVFVLASRFSLDAQITTTVNCLPDGLEEIRIRNNSAGSLVAFAVYAKQVILERQPGKPSGSSASYAPRVVYFDAIEPETSPLLANEERTVMASFRFLAGPSPNRSRATAAAGGRFFEEPIITAGIFADGATAGDAALLSRLMLRRCSMLQAVETALDMISDAGRHNVPREQLIRQFKKMADSVRH